MGNAIATETELDAVVSGEEVEREYAETLIATCSQTSLDLQKQDSDTLLEQNADIEQTLESVSTQPTSDEDSRNGSVAGDGRGVREEGEASSAGRVSGADYTVDDDESVPLNSYPQWATAVGVSYATTRYSTPTSGRSSAAQCPDTLSDLDDITAQTDMARGGIEEEEEAEEEEEESHDEIIEEEEEGVEEEEECRERVVNAETNRADNAYDGDIEHSSTFPQSREESATLPADDLRPEDREAYTDEDGEDEVTAARSEESAREEHPVTPTLLQNSSDDDAGHDEGNCNDDDHVSAGGGSQHDGDDHPAIHTFSTARQEDLDPTGSISVARPGEKPVAASDSCEEKKDTDNVAGQGNKDVDEREECIVDETREECKVDEPTEEAVPKSSRDSSQGKEDPPPGGEDDCAASEEQQQPVWSLSQGTSASGASEEPTSSARPPSPKESCELEGHVTSDSDDNVALVFLEEYNAAGTSATCTTEEEEIDLEFVEQYENTFDLFIKEHPELTTNPELLQNMRVAKLQKLLEVSADVEAELTEHLRNVETLKSDMASSYYNKLREVSRRKASREIHLQQELNTIKQATRVLEGRMTWQMIMRTEARAKRHFQICRHLNDVNVDPNNLLELLPDLIETQSIRDAATAPPGTDLSEEQEKDLRQFQVDNAYLKAEVKMLEKKLVLQKAAAKKHAWVDAVFLRMDQARLKKLKKRFQRKLGVTF